MSAGTQKKPIMIVIVCAAVMVVLYGLSAGFGGSGADGANSWKQRLSGLSLGSPLLPADLDPSGSSCAVVGRTIRVSGSCVLTVAPFGGTFSFQATKQARLSTTSTVILTLSIEGTSTSKSLSPGDDPVDVVIGRAGGTLQVQCPPASVCILELT